MLARGAERIYLRLTRRRRTRRAGVVEKGVGKGGLEFDTCPNARAVVVDAAILEKNVAAPDALTPTLQNAIR